jgi:glycine/D-amino acid oxidase-like deaminating enzyme
MGGAARAPTGVARSPIPSPWLERSRDTDPLAGVARTAAPGRVAPTPEVPEVAEIAVIGGGLAGCSVAYFLAQRDLKCVLLEARTLAGGATGRNGGVFAASHSNPATWAFERQNIEELRAMLAAADEDCEQRTGGYLTVEFEGTEGAAALHERTWDPETEEYWDATKVAAELRTQTLGGDRIAGALFRKDGGAIWPAKLVHALARAAASHTTFCTHTCVLALEPGPDGVVVSTDCGTMVAKQVVVCTNGWAPRLLPELLPFMYPVRNNVLLTTPVERCWSWPGSLTVGTGPDEMYATRQPDGRIVIGGARGLDSSCGWRMNEWAGPALQPGQEDDSVGCDASAAKLREHLGEVLGNFGQELEVEAEWCVLQQTVGFTLLTQLQAANPCCLLPNHAHHHGQWLRKRFAACWSHVLCGMPPWLVHLPFYASQGGYTWIHKGRQATRR